VTKQKKGNGNCFFLNIYFCVLELLFPTGSTVWQYLSQALPSDKHVHNTLVECGENIANRKREVNTNNIKLESKKKRKGKGIN